MIWKLTDRVWWGDRLSIGEEVPGAVINLADNLSINYHNPDEPSDYEFLSLPETVPYFRLSIDDNTEVEPHFLVSLEQFIHLSQRMGWFPLLIHCWEGRHRSPTTAVFAELCIKWSRFKETSRRGEVQEYFEYLWGKMERLRPELVLLEYGRSLQTVLKKVVDPNLDRFMESPSLVQDMIDVGF